MPRARWRRFSAWIATLLVTCVALPGTIHAQVDSPVRCELVLSVDSPAPDSTLRGGLSVNGWAFDASNARSVGVDAVHLYLDGEAGTGRGLGEASLGLPRPDVQAAYGRNSGNSGFSFSSSLIGVDAGSHRLFVYAHTDCGWSQSVVSINVAAPEGWALLNPPPARSSHASAWDPETRQLFVLGGRGGGSSGDFWSYQAATNQWVVLPSPQESPRLRRTVPKRRGDPPPARIQWFAQSAAWDEQGQQMLVFGGFGRGDDGSVATYRPAEKTWDRIDVNGIAPSQRGYHASAWDPSESRLFVFGGVSSHFNLFDDLWAFYPRLHTWEKIVPAGPTPKARFYHSAVWDPVGSQLLIYGGASADEGLLDDLWSYRPELNRWSRLAAGGERPPARLAQAAVWNPEVEGMFMLGGGCGGCYLDDLWTFTPENDAWQQSPSSGPSAPAARGGHSAVWDGAAQQMLVYGGASLNDLWSYRPATAAWTRLGAAGSSLPALSQHRAVWDAQLGQMVVFGGGNRQIDTQALDVLSAYQPSTNRWSSLVTEGDAPLPRSGHSVVWDGAGERALLFGGSHGERVTFDDLWSYDRKRNSWAALAPDGERPTARAHHAATWDAANGQLWVFGGVASNGAYLDDLWVYRASTNKWSLVNPNSEKPAGRIRHTAVWDNARSQLIVFGGYRSGSGYVNELWTYSPAENSWTAPTIAGAVPSPRARHSAIWDAAGSQMVVYGGFAGGTDTSDEVWLYRPDQVSWTQYFSAGAAPGARGDHSAVWDPANAVMLVFGGYAGDAYSDLWSLALRGSQDRAPQTQAATRSETR